MPSANNKPETAMPTTPGMVKLRRKLSIEVLRQAKRGPTPVRNSRNSPIGIIRRSNQGLSRLIFSLVKASEITGKSVPQRTAKQLDNSTRLLNRKLDSRETTLSSSDSLLRKIRRASCRDR